MHTLGYLGANLVNSYRQIETIMNDRDFYANKDLKQALLAIKAAFKYMNSFATSEIGCDSFEELF